MNMVESSLGQNYVSFADLQFHIKKNSGYKIAKKFKLNDLEPFGSTLINVHVCEYVFHSFIRLFVCDVV